MYLNPNPALIQHSAAVGEPYLVLRVWDWCLFWCFICWLRAFSTTENFESTRTYLLFSMAACAVSEAGSWYHIIKATFLRSLSLEAVAGERWWATSKWMNWPSIGVERLPTVQNHDNRLSYVVEWRCTFVDFPSAKLYQLRKQGKIGVILEGQCACVRA